MSVLLTNEIRIANTTLNKQAEIVTASYASYIDDITDQKDPELTA